MYWKSYIMPEQLIFSTLSRYQGRVTRQQLYNEIMRLGSQLEKKGYGVPILIKGAPGRWHSGDIDTPLATYLHHGLLREPEPGVYEFNAWDVEPYTSPREYLKFLADDLDDEACKLLENPGC